MRRLYILFYAVLLFCLFLVIFFRPITAINEDLGRHLLLGRIIRVTQSVPKTNLLSFTYPNFPYVNTSWLSEVIFSWVHSLGGFDMILIFSATVVLLAVSIQLLYTRRRYGAGAILAASTVYLLLLSRRSDIRPEIFSMLFLSVFMVILFSYREKPTKKIFLLLPLEALWTNMHIYFFVGPLLIALFLLDSIFTNTFSLTRSTKLLIVTLIGTLIATLLNPNGLTGALFPYMVLHNYGAPVLENMSLFALYRTYHESITLFSFTVILSLYPILIIGRRERFHIIDWLLVFIFGLGAIIISRNILLFVFTTFIPLVANLDSSFKKLSPFFRSIPRLPIFIAYPISILILIALIVQLLGKYGIGFGLRERGKGAGDFLITHNITGPLYNGFNYGGYFAYRLYPQKVYIDNRPEAYPASFFKDTFIPMQKDPEIFKREDKKYTFNAVVIAHWNGAPLKSALLDYFINSQLFTPVYADDYFVIFLRNTTQNRVFIQQYGLKKTHSKFIREKI